MASKCMLTTVDNPFDPFEQFTSWFMFDEEKGYHTCSYLGRIARTSLIEFGEIKNETEQTVYYSGDAEIGVVITIHAIGNVRNITIYNTGTREVMRIDTDKLEKLTGSGMVAGDEIIISTIKGDKSITLLRNGIYTNILNCLDKDSDWFQLSKGDNIFAYVVEEGTTNVQFKIENRTAFEGVLVKLEL